MRHLWVVALLGAAACTPQSFSRPPPKDAFYFPSGILYVDSPSSPQGMLYVASANYDKRYDSGSVIAVPLSGVAGGNGLPPIKSPMEPSTSPVKIDDLGAGVSQVAIESFAGEMDGYRYPDANGTPDASGRVRLFIPTRAEGNLLEIVDVQDGSLTCLNGGTNCIDRSFSLTALETVADGKPRAPEPVGVGISKDGQVYVTHLKPADSPAKSNRSLETYTVNVAAETPVINASSFISLGLIGLGGGPSTSSVAVGSLYAYLSSRYFGPDGAMIWLLHRQQQRLYRVALESSYRTLEARGVALDSTERRLYVAGRSPDTLVVVDLMNAGTDAPTLRVVRAVPLPEGPNQVRVISRAPGLGNLVVVTSSTAGVVSIYDDGVGRLVAQLPNVGVQPFGLAVRTQKDAQMRDQARIFVSNFGDGRIAVIDLRDLARPQDAELRAYVGKQQTCLVQDQDASCVGVSQ